MKSPPTFLPFPNSASLVVAAFPIILDHIHLHYKLFLPPLNSCTTSKAYKEIASDIDSSVLSFLMFRVLFLQIEYPFFLQFPLMIFVSFIAGTSTIFNTLDPTVLFPVP